jgi:hypothetical protein
LEVLEVKTEEKENVGVWQYWAALSFGGGGTEMSSPWMFSGSARCWRYWKGGKPLENDEGNQRLERPRMQSETKLRKGLKLGFVTKHFGFEGSEELAAHYFSTQDRSVIENIKLF